MTGQESGQGVHELPVGEHIICQPVQPGRESQGRVDEIGKQAGQGRIAEIAPTVNDLRTGQRGPDDRQVLVDDKQPREKNSMITRGSKLLEKKCSNEANCSPQN